ncbi:MAG: class I SAM-dependent methyltransferase [Candidatus Sericytochromatia bacterium]
MSTPVCLSCGHIGPHPQRGAPEQATGRNFDYLVCTGCGSLQLLQVPAQLADYYPADYYSYAQASASGLRGALRRLRNRGQLWDRTLWGRLLARMHPLESLAALQPIPLQRHSRILDLGCGQGQLVSGLRELGYREVWGSDPLLPEGRLPPWILRQELAELAGDWDLIMLHHVLEHVPDPAALLRAARERLSPQGRLLVRVPTVDSWAYAHYGQHWVQWDPPRHLFLFSRTGLEALTQAAGFVTQAAWDDSSAFQFWGSEALRRGRPPRASALPQRLWQDAKARQLNAQGQGDQLVRILAPLK